VENWITRFVAILCAAGGIALLWMLGVFAAVPWHEGRMLSLNRSELQLIGVPLLVGIAACWGALHIVAIADRQDNPRTFATIRAVLFIASIAAVFGGISWTLARIS
jgi:hypothetical protein